ncbi:MAG: metal-dependent hydrolase [Candidatus Hodarchaeota archaeon]
MPDWIAHIMLAWMVSFILKIKGEKRVIFVIGNVLPDVWRYLIVIGDILKSDTLLTFIFYPINNASHSILGILAYSVFFSIFFERTFNSTTKAPVNATLKRGKERRIRYWPIESPMFLLFLGGIIHLFLDMFMWPYGAAGIRWLWPLSTAHFAWSFKLIWPSSYTAILFLIPFFVAELFIESWLRFKKTTGKKQVHSSLKKP